VARDENYTLCLPISQIELRIIAALSGEENMIKAFFLNNEDIHKSTASKVFDVPLEEVTREQRSHAKKGEF
jgi:DNA polymerase-1